MAENQAKPADENAKPDEFKLEIQGGLLDNLGINMYANLGKCLVEFAANAYDGESPSVNIKLDIEAILASRSVVRKAAVAAAKAAKKKPPSFVEDSLPGNLTVVIEDKGHGMTPSQVQTRYLPINRNRRKDESGEEVQSRTEAGKRFVMGRKGIGKLSGFGAASLLMVRTKRKGQTFATEFSMSLAELRNKANLADVRIKPTYIEGQASDDSGTTITLKNLKCDSMKFTQADVEDALAEAFFPVKDAEFRIEINGKPINRPVIDYEYIWPDKLTDGYASDKAGDDEMGELPFKYVAKFRKSSLPATKRGARIYANGRLAFGPSLLNLNTGTHNFMAHQYLEFLVEADELDRQNVDLISTDRGDIRRNNDLVEAFLTKLTDLMQKAIAAHGKFRDIEAEKIIDEDPKAERVRKILDALPGKQKTAGRKLVNVIVSRYGVESEEFEAIAPLVVQSMNAGEVLVELIKQSVSPTNITELASAITELRTIERSDALKVYRGRRNGVHGLRVLTNKGEEKWQKGENFEGELHGLLKQAPWLIRPELNGYIASDEQLKTVTSKLARELAVDKFAAAAPAAGASDKAKQTYENTRPDLVFLLGNSEHADRVLVVELKSPNIPLELEHLNQLERYIRKVEAWHAKEFADQKRKRPMLVDGILIGAMPDKETKAEGALDLMNRIGKRTAQDQWEVVGLNMLLEQTEAVHREQIAALEKEEQDDNDEKQPAKPALKAVS